jgi:hypothetical protein
MESSYFYEINLNASYGNWTQDLKITTMQANQLVQHYCSSLIVILHFDDQFTGIANLLQLLPSNTGLSNPVLNTDQDADYWTKVIGW